MPFSISNLIINISGKNKREKLEGKSNGTEIFGT